MTFSAAQAPTSVLLDLDGTLLDTAPDLASALNRVRAQHGMQPLSFDQIRPHVSHGSFALTRIGCTAPEDSEDFENFRLALLQYYADNVAQDTRLFDGMEQVLLNLEALATPWGIVTNKPSWLTTPLLAQLDLSNRAAVVISGDTITQSKPHPAPLLLAAKRLQVPAYECVYIGDAERDIIAGKAAGMRTVAALYGYIGAEESPASWGADVMVRTPLELTQWLASF